MKKIFLKTFICLCCVFLCNQAYGWGFYAHKLINKSAVFALPPSMISFYKYHLTYLIENSTAPDLRRTLIPNEGSKHFIDLETYYDSLDYIKGLWWNKAKEKYSEDSLNAHGIVPWHIQYMKFALTKAFASGDIHAILKLSADMGHYIADSNVPLHTTRNYNGQYTNQKGIHNFWEGRLPEVCGEKYNFIIGKAEYIKDPGERAWKAVISAHSCIDRLLITEKQLSKEFPQDKIFAIEVRNGQNVKVYSRHFVEKYENLLQGEVERQMKASVKMLADFWYTCWVDGGQPDLNVLVNQGFSKEQLIQREEEKKQLKKQTEEVEKEKDLLICH